MKRSGAERSGVERSEADEADEADEAEWSGAERSEADEAERSGADSTERTLPSQPKRAKRPQKTQSTAPVPRERAARETRGLDTGAETLMLSFYVAAAARARCISTACESRASTGIFSNIAETAEDVPDLSAALSCLRLTTPDLQLSYPEDADAHFEQLQQALAPWLQSTPHKYAGHSGPWIENVWISL